MRFLEQNLEPACYLYRHYHPSGDLLYAGISLEPLRRQETHTKTARWRNMICRIVIEPFATREAALTAEQYAIRTEFPKFNATHNGQRHPIQELARRIAPQTEQGAAAKRCSRPSPHKKAPSAADAPGPVLSCLGKVEAMADLLNTGNSRKQLPNRRPCLTFEIEYAGLHYKVSTGHFPNGSLAGNASS